MGNAEWAGIVGAVHAEARKAGCDHPREGPGPAVRRPGVRPGRRPARAPSAYAHLAASFPEAVKPIHAWLYGRAAAPVGVQSPRDLDLFALTFQHAGPARAFFEKQGWDFGEVEYAYLARSLGAGPGQVPRGARGRLPRRGEAFLLGRSREQEQAGQKEPACETAEVLFRLAPRSLAAHDRLACLHYRLGDIDRSVELLDGWQRARPGGPLAARPPGRHRAGARQRRAPRARPSTAPWA